METTEQKHQRKDTIVLAAIIVILGFIFLYYDTFLSPYAHVIVGMSFILCFCAGLVARDRKIGFGPVFFISLFLSPVVGFIFAFTSARVRDEEFDKKMRDVAYNTSIADQLLKLNELRKEGILSDEEFQAQKQKLLSQSNS